MRFGAQHAGMYYTRSMKDSIFTQIIKGEIPCHKVYEDDRTLAFMDIRPIQRGAVLVISKLQTDHFLDLPDDDYQALMATVRKVGLRIRSVFPEKARVGVIIEGFEVPHVHVKVFPVDSGNEVRHMPDVGLEPDHADLEALAKKLRIKS